VTSYRQLLRVRWFVVAALATGCSLAVDAGRTQCSEDSDCTKRGGTFAGSVCQNSVCVLPESEAGMTKPPPDHMPDAGPAKTDGGKNDAGPVVVADWSCMDEPKVVTPELGPFHVSLKLTDINAMNPPPKGVQGQLCNKLDPDCASPLGDLQISDANGVMAFDAITKNFAGYVALTGAGFTPGLFFFNPPVYRDLDAIAVQEIPPTLVTGLISLLKQQNDPNGGIVLEHVTDCKGVNAAHVSFAANVQSATRYYAIGGLPTTAATETDTAGFGGFVNVSFSGAL